QGELRGVYDTGLVHREFVAYDTLVEDSDDPASSCAALNNQQSTVVGMRCIWQTADGSAYKPIDLTSLVASLNQNLASASLEITQNSGVVLEAYGGMGHHGHQQEGSCGTAPGGNGGFRGYARTLWSLDALQAVNTELYIYPGESGAVVGEGGAGTIIATVDLSSLTSQQLSSTDSNEVEDLGILAIAGGGGGGSFASRSTVDLTNEISPLILGSGDAEIQSQVAVTFQVLPASN
ncbi:MAG: hypothetical protein GTO40_25925, partial [Deltaproteobacteria bacterium]|nr:hypothetical protein [Deltaproteobacteria bacterium]